ncbi:MAG: SURF1 family protein [Proteobacteria bacterium]|nr:MAG: SURF1 family protein [Pseudomonadota bacterium]
MVLHFGVYECRLSRWSSLSSALGLAVFIFLGQWQLERAAQKQALVDEYSQRALQAPIEIDGRLRPWADYRYSKAVAHGQYDLQRQWLLDNRIHNGRAGYHVLTPLLIDGHNAVVLVNRGWISWGMRRSRLPELPGPNGVVTVRGTIHPPPKVYQLAPDKAHDGTWPAVVQALALDKMAAALGFPLLPIVIHLEPDDEHGFIREWQAVVGMTPAKHRAYAVQWFLFAVVLCGITVGVNTRRVDR